MLLTNEQLAVYEADGYIVVPAPWPTKLTVRLQSAVDQVAASEHILEELNAGARSTQWRLQPQPDTGSGANVLDQSFEFLQVMLHPEVIELARQLEGSDVFFRNGGINELRPDRSILWHHDYKNDPFTTQKPTAGVEFMHYFGGADTNNGCFRVIPGSHSTPQRKFAEDSPSPFEKQLQKCRAAAGVDSTNWSDAPGRDTHPVDIKLPGERSIVLNPNQLLVRSTTLFHASHNNCTNRGRLM